MTVTYCNTLTVAIILDHNSAQIADIEAAYKSEGHFRHVVPLVNASGELMWRLSLIEALAQEPQLNGGVRA